MIKRFIFILVLVLLTTSIANAQTCLNVGEQACPAVPKVNGPISSTLSTVTGMNWLISNTLESQVKKQLNKALNGDFKVQITPFGAKSMLQGKFKKIEFNSDSAFVEGLYLSNIKAESLCGYNHFVYKNGEVYTNENFILGFYANITSEDLQKSVMSPEYTKLLNSLNVSLGKITILKVFDPKAEIKNDRLVFTVKVISPATFNEPRLISTDMGLAVENGKLLFTNIRTSPDLHTHNLNSLLPIINKINPFVINTAILNNPKSSIQIKDVIFEGNKIAIKGVVIVPKNYYNN